MVNEVVKAGDKIEIRLLQQTQKMKINRGIPDVYRSVVLNIEDDEGIEISMPFLKEKIVILDLGVRCELVFYTKEGLYHCEGQVKERYRSDNLYMLLIEPTTPLSKHQRREFYRLTCSKDMEYMVFEPDLCRLEDPIIIEKQHLKRYPDDLKMPGILVDISGGGLRFISEGILKVGLNLLVSFHLQSDSVDEQCLVAGKILQVITSTNEKKQHEYRLQFQNLNVEVQERIVKYVFEEERKYMKK